MLLETDSKNTAEIAGASQSTAPKLALFFYRDRIAEGYAHECAYVMALAYLRRKTGLSVPLAMASLDELIKATSSLSIPLAMASLDALLEVVSP